MDRISILTYHSLDTSASVISLAPEVFAAHMAVLADLGFRGISLREAVAWRQDHGTWPPRSVVLTFDDGYANFCDAALPELSRRGFGATVFLVTGHVGGHNDWAPPPAGLGRRAMLSWEQAAELLTMGIEIGSHTRTHPNLRRLSAAAMEREIAASQADIEDRLGTPVDSFAYPFGAVSPAARAFVSREFRAGCTTVLKCAGAEPAECLPRIDAYYLRSATALRRLLTGRLDRKLAIRRWGRTMRRAFLESIDWL